MIMTDPPIYQSTLLCLQSVLALRQAALLETETDIRLKMRQLESDFKTALPQDRLSVVPFLLSIVKHILKHPSSTASALASGGTKPSKLALGALEMIERSFEELPSEREKLHAVLLSKTPQDNEKVCQEIVFLLFTILDSLKPALRPEPVQNNNKKKTESSAAVAKTQQNADVEALALCSFQLLETIIRAFLDFRRIHPDTSTSSDAPSIFQGTMLAPLIEQCLMAAQTPCRPLSLRALTTLSLLLDLSNRPSGSFNSDSSSSSPPWRSFFPGIFSSLFKLCTGPASNSRGAAIRSAATGLILQALAAIANESLPENLALQETTIDDTSIIAADADSSSYSTFRLNLLQHIQRPLLLLLPPLLISLPPSHRLPLYAALLRLLQCPTFFGGLLVRDLVPVFLFGVTDECLGSSSGTGGEGRGKGGSGIWGVISSDKELDVDATGKLLGSAASLQQGLVEALWGLFELCSGVKMGASVGNDGELHLDATSDCCVVEVLGGVSEQALEMLLRTAIGYAHVVTVLASSGSGSRSVSSSPLRPILRAVRGLCYSILPLFQPSHQAATQLLEVCTYMPAQSEGGQIAASYSGGYYRSPLACSLSDKTARLGRQLCASLGRGGMVPDLLEAAAHLQRQLEADDARGNSGDPACILNLISALRCVSFGLIGMLEGGAQATEESESRSSDLTCSADPDAVVSEEWRSPQDGEGERERDRVIKTMVRLSVRLLAHHVVRLPLESSIATPTHPAHATATDNSMRSLTISAACELLATCAMLIPAPLPSESRASTGSASRTTPRLFLVSALYPLLRAAIASDAGVKVAARTTLGRLALYFGHKPPALDRPALVTTANANAEADGGTRALLLVNLDLVVDNVCSALQASSSNASTAHRDTHLVLEFALKTIRGGADSLVASPPQVTAQLKPLMQAAFSSIDRLALCGRLGAAASRPLWGVLEVLVGLLGDEEGRTNTGAASISPKVKGGSETQPEGAADEDATAASKRVEAAIASSLSDFYHAVQRMLKGEDFYSASQEEEAAAEAGKEAAVSDDQNEDGAANAKEKAQDEDEEEDDTNTTSPPFPEHELLQSVVLRCCYFMGSSLDNATSGSVAGRSANTGATADTTAMLYDRVRACGVMEKAFLGLAQRPASATSSFASGKGKSKGRFSSLLLPTIHKVWSTVVSRLVEAANALVQYREATYAIISTSSSLAPGHGPGLGRGSSGPSSDKALNTPPPSSASLQSLPPLLSLLTTISTLGGDFLAIKFEDDFWRLYVLMLEEAAGLQTLRGGQDGSSTSAVTVSALQTSPTAQASIMFRDAGLGPEELRPTSNHQSRSSVVTAASASAFASDAPPPPSSSGTGNSTNQDYSSHSSYSLHTRIKSALLRLLLALTSAAAPTKSNMQLASIRSLLPAQCGRLAYCLLPYLLSHHGAEVVELACEGLRAMWMFDRGWVGTILSAFEDASAERRDMQAWAVVSADPRVASSAQRNARRQSVGHASGGRRLPEAAARDKECLARLQSLTAWAEVQAIECLVDVASEEAWMRKLAIWGAL